MFSIGWVKHRLVLEAWVQVIKGRSGFIRSSKFKFQGQKKTKEEAKEEAEEEAAYTPICYLLVRVDTKETHGNLVDSVKQKNDATVSNQYENGSHMFLLHWLLCKRNSMQEEKLNIPMKSKVMRTICIGFNELLMRFPPEFVARYAIMTETRNPFKQSEAYIELLCRAHTCSNKTNCHF